MGGKISMKSVFSLKGSLKGHALSWLTYLEGLRRHIGLPIFLYVLTLVLIGTGYVFHAKKIQQLKDLEVSHYRLIKRFERVRDTMRLESVFKAAHTCLDEQDHKEYLKALFERYTPLSDDIQSLHYLIGQKAFKHSEELKQQVEELEHEKRIVFERSGIKTKRRRGFIETEFQLAEPISLQEGHFYDLLARLEGQQQGAPQLGIKRLTFSIHGNNLLNIHTMKVFQREFITHEK